VHFFPFGTGSRNKNYVQSRSGYQLLIQFQLDCKFCSKWSIFYFRSFWFSNWQDLVLMGLKFRCNHTQGWLGRPNGQTKGRIIILIFNRSNPHYCQVTFISVGLFTIQLKSAQCWFSSIENHQLFNHFLYKVVLQKTVTSSSISVSVYSNQ